VSRFEACPLAYKFHYLDRLHAEPGVPLRFGKLVHSVIETLVREHVDDEREGPLELPRAYELYRTGWAEDTLSGIEVYEEGLGILRDFVRLQGELDHRSALAIEKEFRLPVGPFTVLGYIDRVDWVDDETIRVIDYKTNRLLFGREDVDHSLQLSLYAVAARRLWPWAKKVELRYWMLRHGAFQDTTRTEEQLSDALSYIETLGAQMENAEVFPARINPNCCYCDHRQHCPAYAQALTGKRDVVAADLTDLEAVAREREEVTRLSKLLSGRKAELEDVLKTHIKQRGELALGGVLYRMFTTTSLDYAVEPTVTLLAEALDAPREVVAEKLLTIDKRALDSAVADLSKKLPAARVALLKAEIEAHATKVRSSRFWAKAGSGAKHSRAAAVATATVTNAEVES
jgi:RecB family exonuclease